MPRIVNRLFGPGLGLLLLGTGLAGCSSKVQDWTFTDAQGAVRNLSDFEGNVIVLAFSNSWCDPCQEAAVHMQDIHDRFAAEGVKVVYISSWERGDAEEYMKENGYTYGLVIDGTEIARDYRVDRVPTFYVVGVDGRVVYRHEGFESDTPHKMVRAIEKHLKRAGKRSDHVAQHGG